MESYFLTLLNLNDLNKVNSVEKKTTTKKQKKTTQTHIPNKMSRAIKQMQRQDGHPGIDTEKGERDDRKQRPSLEQICMTL